MDSVRKNINKLFVIVSIIVSSLAVNIQDVTGSTKVTFQKTYGASADWEYASSVQQTTDGGYIITGRAYSFGGVTSDADIYLIRTDSIGDTLWTKIFGVSTGNDFGFSVQQTSDGGFILTGRTANYGAGGVDVLLIRMDPNGTMVWVKTYGGTGDDYGLSTQQTSDNGFIIAGHTYSFSAGADDVYLIRTDFNGDTLWTKTYGGTGSDWANSVQQTTDGGYIVAGKTQSFGAGDYDVYVIRTNSIGDTLWTRTYGGTGTDYGYAVEQTVDSGFVITGRTASFGAGGVDVYLIRTDPNGDTLWTKTYGGSLDDYGLAVQQTKDNGFIIAGETYSFGAGSDDAYLIRTDINGDTLWTKAYGGSLSDYASSVRQTLDGGYILAGRTASYGSGSQDVYLIKTDSLGNSGCNQSGTQTIVKRSLTKISSGASIGSGATVLSDPVNISNPPTITGVQCLVVCNLYASITDSTASCQNDSNGTAVVTATGGTPPYTFRWNDKYSQTDSIADSLGVGSYQVTVTDVNNCKKIASVTILGVPNATIKDSSNVSCNGGNDGIASASGNGGTLPYTYNWSTGETTQIISGLGPGTYMFTLTDATLCKSIASVTITEPADLLITFIPKDVSCANGSDGSISTVITGGTSPYNYLWSNGGISASLSTLLTGIYTVTITDTYGCVSMLGYSIGEPTAMTSQGQMSNVSCNGGNDGMVSVTAIGGTPGYSYSWSNGATSQTNTTLSAGIYYITITDLNNCQLVDTIGITEPGELIISIEVTPTSCVSADGAVSTSVSGGTSPYSYMWSNGMTVANISSVDTGNYSVVVTHANGCLDSANTTVNCDLVWPGDVDVNLISDHYDLMGIGLHYDETGPARQVPYQTTLWDGYPALAWGSAQKNGNDLKHVDCNGDGVVDVADIIAIINNFGLTHAKHSKSQYNKQNPDLYFELLSGDIAPGSTVEIAIMVGRDTTKAIVLGRDTISMYGIGFEVKLDGNMLTIIEDSTLAISWDNNWLGTQGTDLLILDTINSTTGEIFAACVKNNHLNSEGSGEIARIHFDIKKDLAGRDTMQVNIQINTNGGVKTTGDTITFNNDIDTLTINPAPDGINLEPGINNTKIRIYPNPINKDRLELRIVGLNEQDRKVLINLTNILGEMIFSDFLTITPNGSAILTIDRSKNIKPGIYIISGISTRQIFNKQLVIR